MRIGGVLRAHHEFEQRVEHDGPGGGRDLRAGDFGGGGETLRASGEGEEFGRRDCGVHARSPSPFCDRARIRVGSRDVGRTRRPRAGAATGPRERGTRRDQFGERSAIARSASARARPSRVAARRRSRRACSAGFRRAAGRRAGGSHRATAPRRSWTEPRRAGLPSGPHAALSGEPRGRHEKGNEDSTRSMRAL
jgi:hypothetical protein